MIGFRIGWRLGDNLFVLTQSIEMSREERRPLFLAFLDITGAHDKVYRNIFWDILEGEDLGIGSIQLMRQVYLGNALCVKWEGMSSVEKV